jgi:hypothetical protein
MQINTVRHSQYSRRASLWLPYRVACAMRYGAESDIGFFTSLT